MAASWCFSDSKPHNAHLRGDSHHARFQKNIRWRPPRCPMNILRPLLACNRGVITSQKWPQNFHRPPGRSPYEIFWNHAQSVTNSESQKKLSQRPNRRENFNRERGEGDTRPDSVLRGRIGPTQIFQRIKTTATGLIFRQCHRYKNDRNLRGVISQVNVYDTALQVRPYMTSVRSQVFSVVFYVKRLWRYLKPFLLPLPAFVVLCVLNRPVLSDSLGRKL